MHRRREAERVKGNDSTGSVSCSKQIQYDRRNNKELNDEGDGMADMVFHCIQEIKIENHMFQALQDLLPVNPAISEPVFHATCLMHFFHETFFGNCISQYQV